VSAIPRMLLAALEQRAPELKRVEFMHLHLSDVNPCATVDHAESFFTNNLFIVGAQRNLVAEGYSSYVPVFLSEIPKLIERYLIPDVALLNVSPPDRNGYCSLEI
jgi:4-hydroxybutyrate CoA-transferase